MLDQKVFIYVKDVVSIEMANFMTEALRLKAALGSVGDSQCPNAKVSVHNELIFQTLLEKMWPKIEAVIGEKLIPTYCYSRLYGTDDVLEKHTDRDSCEVSMTVQLGRSHHYSWPIYMEGQRFDLGVGEGIIYTGCTAEHWRDKCDPPDDTYYSGQVFLHYVKENGTRAEFAGDKLYEVLPYVRNRNHQLA